MPHATAEAPPDSPDTWDKWIRPSLSAVLGAACVMVPVILWFGDVRTDAKNGAALIPRVNTLEQHEAEDRADARSAKEMLQEMRGDVKKILERLPR